MRIGVISDTHGLLRTEAVAALAGVDAILHAGDVGDEAVLEGLRRVAPVTAIRGNIDRVGVCAELPATEVVEFGGVSVYILHSVADLDLDPEAAGFGVVISGHSHRAAIERRGKVVYFNPGSAGPRRFALPVTVGMLRMEAGVVTAEVLAVL